MLLKRKYYFKLRSASEYSNFFFCKLYKLSVFSVKKKRLNKEKPN